MLEKNNFLFQLFSRCPTVISGNAQRRARYMCWNKYISHPMHPISPAGIVYWELGSRFYDKNCFPKGSFHDWDNLFSHKVGPTK